MSTTHLARGSALPPLRKDVWRLYSMRFCPYAERTRIVLCHKQIPYETVNVNLKRKPMWLFERNPLGLVPVLEFNDLVLHESAVCDDYLDDAFPNPRLTPRDPLDRARQRVIMERFQQVATALYKVGRPDDDGKKARKTMTRCLNYYENLLTAKYFGGEQPSMVDFHIWPWFERMPVVQQLSGYDCLPKNDFPKLSQWTKTMMDVEAVKKNFEPPELQMKFMIALGMGQPEYDFQEEASSKL